MIDIKTLFPTDVGRQVKYKAFGEYQYGRITSWNDKVIFVRYTMKVDTKTGKETMRTGSTSEATTPEDLEFV